MPVTGQFFAHWFRLPRYYINFVYVNGIHLLTGANKKFPITKLFLPVTPETIFLKTKLLVCIAGLLLAFSVKGQTPVAAFTVSPTSGCLNNGTFTVICTNSSTNAATSSFDYGDGTGNTTVPVHTYTQSGTFTITLTVTSAGGLTDVTTHTVNILAPPTVAFSASPTTGCFPMNVQFTDNSTSATGTNTGWSWDFGDGTISNLQNPVHVYTDAGNYPVSLTVTNSNGCSSSLRIAGYIQITNGVSADFSAAVSSGCNPPIAVNFTNQTTGNAPNITYTWDFGDGTPPLIQNSLTPGPTHNYNTTSGFTVSLVATSTSGCTDTFTNIVHVNGGSAVSGFIAPDSVCIGVPVTFQNTTAPSASTTNWVFGDGATSTQINPIHTYATAGTYTVQLNNTFGPCSDNLQKPIVVLNIPVAGFTATGNTASCTPPLTVNFTNTSANGVNSFWDFGDGTTSNQQNPSHTYTVYGQFNVKLVASSATGCIDSIIQSSVVQIVKPTVSVTNLPAFGCIHFTFTPVAAVTAVDGVASYAWDFGDGTTSALQNPPGHVYSVSGTYAVKLVIVTNGGCTASFVDSVKVGANKPTANFSFSPNPVCVYSNVQFTDMSTGTPPPDQWFWTFPTVGNSTLQNPNEPFNVPGTYMVTLKVFTGGCWDTLSKALVVSPPATHFNYSVDCANKTQVSFTNTTIGAASWVWDFGDGTSFTGQTPPTHTYVIGGVYIATLTATNGSCTNQESKTIQIVNEKASFVTSSTVACKNSPVTFTVTNSNSANISSYSWNFGDTIISGPQDTIISHGYKNAGTYTVKLTITDINGCKDSSNTTTIQVNGPTANFSTTASNGCKGLVANFTDLSTTDGTHNIVSWIWDFGDGTVQTYSGPPFSHIYLTQGNFTVNLKVVDASGCADSLSQVNLINIYAPIAVFTTPDSMSCPGSAVQFVNTSSGYGLTYNWDFGDATAPSTTNDPAHPYAAVGNYTVQLKVVDQYGCRDSTLGNIIIDTPHASFNVSDSMAKCPPLQVNYTFTGHYNKTVNWIFADGATSTRLNPTHIYTLPGVYIDTLIVTSPGGCTSMATDTITILGPNGQFSYTPETGCKPLTVNFSVVTGGVVSYTWDFNDGNSQTTTVPTNTYTYTTAGNYLPVVILQDTSSPPCNVPIVGKDTIKVIGSVPKFGVDKNILCGSGTVQFSDSTTSNGGITGYSWDFGDGTPTSNAMNPSHVYALPGLYTVKLIVTTQGSCVDSVIRNNLIKVATIPDIDISGVSSQCVPFNLAFGGVVLVPDTSALTWHWTFYNQPPSNLQNPPSLLYNVPGSDSVQLIVINSSGCADTVTKYFSIYPLPQVSAGADTTICLGQSATLTASGATTYNWLPPTSNTLSCINCASPVATPIFTSSYVVEGTSAFGCVKEDNVLVTVLQPQTITVSPLTDSICVGQSVPLNASGESLYIWSPATGLSNPGIANPSASPTITTVYQVIGTDSKFCFSDTQFVKITVFDYPTVNLGPDATIPVGSSYQINGIGSSDIDLISWTPTTGLSCTDCLSPLASPVSTTTYIARVVNNGGCATMDSITIIVTCNNSNLFVPNTFSPNGDGMNDVFYVRGKGLSSVQSMRIFDRWGQMVFEKRNFAPNDPSVGWDGTMNGKKAPVDVYIYTIEVICENSVVVAYHGNVALIR